MVAESKFTLPYWAEVKGKARERKARRRLETAVQMVVGKKANTGSSSRSIISVPSLASQRGRSPWAFPSQSQSSMRNFKILLAAPIRTHH